MSDTTQVDSPQRISRRTVVKGGLVAGGALWAVPAVQVLTATKAFASTASSTNPSPSPTAGGISYIMLVFKSGGVTYTAKVDEYGTVFCEIAPGAPTATSLWNTYLSNNGWTIDTSGICPSITASVSGNSTTVNLGSAVLVGYMVHDGSLNSDPGQVAFDPDNAGSLTKLPATWTVTTTGTSVTFNKP